MIILTNFIKIFDLFSVNKYKFFPFFFDVKSGQKIESYDKNMEVTDR